MKRVFFSILMVLALSSCNALNRLGLYTEEQYMAQAAEITEQAGEIESLTNTNSGLQKQVEDLSSDKSELEGQVTNFKEQVRELTLAKDKANTDMAKYKSMVCEGITWENVVNDIRVWYISEGNPELIQLETDTKVSFFLTQMLTLDEPVSDEELYYILVVDFYNGIALNSRDGCLIFDENWDFGQSA